MIHGFRTVFPIPLGQAATFDPELVEQGARIAAIEASAAGIRWTFSPMLDISRDPRWGRIAESAGEDPCLTSAMGAAMVKDIRAKVRTTRPPSPHAPSTSWATEPARAAGTTTRPT